MKPNHDFRNGYGLNLFARVGRPLLTCLIALLLTIVGSESVWGQISYGKAEISAAPGASTGWQTITNQGNVKAWYNGTSTEFTNGAKEIGGKWYVKLSDVGFIKIRVAKGSVVAGDILRVETIDIYQNDDQQNLGFKVKGSDGTVTLKETDNALHTLDYILKAGDINVDPEDGSFDYIQFDRNGNSGCGYHSVEILKDKLDASVFKTWTDINGNSSNGTASGEFNLGSSVDAGGTVYGDGNVYYLNYVNVKGGAGAIMPNAKHLIIEGNSGVAVRILVNRVSDGGSHTELEGTIPSNGKLIIDISSYDTFHLNAIKIPYNGSTGNVVNSIRISNSLTSYTVNVNRTGLPTGCDAYFTIGSDATKHREQQWVPEGTQVTFTMNSEDLHYSPSGWRTEGWNSTHDKGWMGYTASFTTTIRGAAEDVSLDGCNHDYSLHERLLYGNLNPTPEFNKFFFVKAIAETGGTATVTDASGHNTSERYDSTTGELTFTATPNAGYTFDGWYNTSGTKVGTNATWNSGTYGAANSDVDLIYTAKFNATPLLTIGKPECNHYGARTHGDNYFDIQRLNPLNGVTIGVADNGSGRKINVPTNGGAVKFVFDNSYNLACLVGWTISNNEGLRNRVSAVEFFTDAECTNPNRVADFWTGAGDRNGINDNRLNNQIKAIRISFKEGEATSYDINWICFKFEHRANQLPTLTEGTEAEMVIYTDETLKITNTPGYWRQYTKSNYDTPTGDNINGCVQIPTGEYKSTYTFEHMKNGNYYFGARDGVWCSLGYDHGQTELVTVHVQVTNPPTNLRVVYDVNGGEGTVPVDNNTYKYKDNATILPPGDIAKDGYFFSHWSLNQDGSGDKYSTDAEKGNTTVVVNKQELRLYAVWEQLGFKGWFNFENRLIAQWNFDLSDEVRLNLPTLDKSTSYWDKDATDPNKILYTYKQALDYKQLTYDGTNIIPVSAGLKFKASGEGTEKVQILVTKDNTGKITNVQFCLDAGVKLDVPYVRNSYRNDKGSDYAPYQWEGPVENPTWNYFDPGEESSKEGFMHFQDCLHHLNRDIVYVVSDPDILTYGAGRPITNLCADGTNASLELFNNGGDENVKGLPDGVHKTWRKCNFTGTQGDRCIIEFSKPIKIDRIAVNRNLVYSFYTENTAVTTGGKYDKPFPGMRLVGSPQGQRVANVGGTWTEYSGAIAVTFGGWKYNDNQYKDGGDVDKKDTWADLNVYQGRHENINSGAELEGNRDYNVDYSKIDITNVPFASDGFPVYSRLGNRAYNETVNPTASNDPFDINTLSYHDQSNGNFFLSRADGGTYEYIPNLTPWSLPCRGAYVKFEPTLPGVLNVDILQDGGATYYIADEFGHLVKDNVYTKVGQTHQVIDKGDSHDDNTKAGHFKVTGKSYVKYSFNVYPGKSYYLFSNDGGMGVSGFYFEPYVYRKYNSRPSTKYADEDFELSRINVGIKTAEMTGGPNFSWTDTTDDNMDYTNQAAHTGVTKLVNPTNDKNKRHENTSVILNPQSGEFEAIHKNTNPHITNNVNDINYVTLDNKAVHVTYNRSFTTGKWSSICLPYSMNSMQIEQAFGEGTKVVLLRDVQDKDKNGYVRVTANFIYHINQDIIAGYPYLIYPTKENITKIEANVYLDNETANITETWSSAPSIVTINSIGQNTVSYPADVTNTNNNLTDYYTAESSYASKNSYNYDGLHCFDFTGNYAEVNLPAGSYVVAANGQLTRLPSQQPAAPFRAYMKYDMSKESDHAFHSKPRYIEAVNFGELSYEPGEIDGIEDILLESGIVGAKTDVYSINGQVIRKHTDNLQGLKKGLYIVNGKKYLVK